MVSSYVQFERDIAHVFFSHDSKEEKSRKEAVFRRIFAHAKVLLPTTTIFCLSKEHREDACLILFL
jgi:hypothetical protein